MTQPKVMRGSEWLGWVADKTPGDEDQKRSRSHRIRFLLKPLNRHERSVSQGSRSFMKEQVVMVLVVTVTRKRVPECPDA